MLLCLLISSAITIDECAVGEADLTSIDMHDVTVSNNRWSVKGVRTKVFQSRSHMALRLRQ